MTSAESTLLGIVVGAFLTWLLGRSAAHSQWRREERRRQADRRAELYEDMLVEQDRVSRQVGLLLSGRLDTSRYPTEDELGLSARWTARVALFASPEVKDLWKRWHVILGERADLEEKYISASSTPGPGRDQMAMAALEVIAEWIRRVTSASDSLADQMRRELEP